MPRESGSGAGTDGAEGKATGDSSVRDHLANERTYLAWLRTGMALLGLGFVVARMRIQLGPETPDPGGGQVPFIGFGFAGLGMLAVLFATWRYLAVRRMIDRQRFEALGSSVLVISAASLAVAIGVVFYLLSQVLG